MYCATTVGLPGRCLPICCATRRPHWSLPPPVPGMMTVTFLPVYGISDCAVARLLMPELAMAATPAARYRKFLQEYFMTSPADHLHDQGLSNPKRTAIWCPQACTVQLSVARREGCESPCLASNRSGRRRCNRTRPRS